MADTLTFAFRYYEEENQEQMYSTDPDAETFTFVFRKTGDLLELNGEPLPLKTRAEYNDSQRTRHADTELDNPESIFRSSLEFAIEDRFSTINYECVYSMAPITAVFEEFMWRFIQNDVRLHSSTITIDNCNIIRFNDGEWHSMPTTGSGMIGWDTETFVETLIS